jgi:hypothetical protein
MTTKVTLILILLHITSVVVHAQDKIQEKSGAIINAKVIDVTPEDVLYRRVNDANRTTLRIDVKDVLQIIYDNGDTLVIKTDSLSDSLSRAKNIQLKGRYGTDMMSINALSPLFNRVTIAYEIFRKGGALSLKVPIAFNYKYAAPYIGLELKIFPTKQGFVRGFVAPAFNAGLKPVSVPILRNNVPVTTVNNYKFIEGLIKAGLSVQATKMFNITVDGGVGKTNFLDPSITVPKTLLHDIGLHLGYRF